MRLITLITNLQKNFKSDYFWVVTPRFTIRNPRFGVKTGKKIKILLFLLLELHFMCIFRFIPLHWQLDNTHNHWNKCFLIILAKNHHILSPGIVQKYSICPTFSCSSPRNSKNNADSGLIFPMLKLDITTKNLSLSMPV